VKVGSWRLEGAPGFGAETHVERNYSFDPIKNVYFPFQDITKARAYARVALAGTIALAPQVEAVAQIIGHLTFTDKANGGYVLAAVGLRLTLP
jgi:hypothetical protein